MNQLTLGAVAAPAKRWLERNARIRIYRHSVPHGLEVINDLKRVPEWTTHPEVIFDIGAHHGGTVARFRAEYPSATIYAFEPSSLNRIELTTAFGSDSRVKIYPLAVSKRNGTAVLQLGATSTMHRLLKAQDVVSDASEQVTTVTLDSFCESERVSRVQFCKIDTEGHDLEVLLGATGLLSAQRIDFVQFETSFRRDTDYFHPIWDMDTFMNQMQYEMFGIYEQQPCWTGRSSLLYVNAVYVRSTLVNERPVLPPQ